MAATNLPEGESPRATALRIRAEELLRINPVEFSAIPARDLQSLVQELSVHQIELEMQNVELRRTQLELAESRDRYSDLYEFAPVGYLTLNPEGVILEANLTASRILGVPRQDIVQANLSKFVTPQSQDRFYLYRRSLAGGTDHGTCELQMRQPDGTTRDMLLESIAFKTTVGLNLRIALLDITENKAATDALGILKIDVKSLLAVNTDALRNSANYVRLLTQAITNLADGVMITDGELDAPGPRFLFVNDAICRMTGYSAEELIGQTPRILQGDRTDLAMKQKIRTELSAGRSCQVELTNYRKDGTTFEVELFIGPMYDSVGRLTNFISISRDITARKQAEAERAQLVSIVQSSSDAIVSTSLDGTILTWNDGASRLFGYLPEEILGQSISALVPADRVEEFRDVFTRTRRGERLAPMETVRLGKHDRRIDVSLTVSPIVDSQGHVVAESSISRDITEQKRMEHALKLSEEGLRAVLNTAADAIIMIDRRGVILTFNRAAEVMFGYDSSEVIGQNVKILMPPPFHDEHDGYLQRYLETGVQRIIGVGREVTGQRKDGTRFPLDLAVSEVDHMHLYTGILRDISRRKQLERDVIESASLEQQRIGQDLHDSIGQQLTGLMLLTRALVDSVHTADLISGKSLAGSPDYVSLNDRLERLGAGLEHALNDIRAICRELSPVPISKSGLVPALQNLIDEARARSDVDCTFICPGPISLLDNVAATHLFNIAQGALSNALRHSKAHEIQIHLNQTTSELTLAIRDNGVGISDFNKCGLGIRIMQNRAKIIGGMLIIRPVQPTGTEVVCIIPVGQPTNDENYITAAGSL